MKKIYNCILFCVLLTLTSKGQYYSQYFDGAAGFGTLAVTIVPTLGNVWQIGPPQKTLFHSPASAPNVIITDTIRDSLVVPNSTFTFDAPPGGTGLTAIRWKQKLDFDSGKDGGVVEFSIDGGSIWQNAHNNFNVYQFYGFQPGNKDTLANGDFAFSGIDTTWRDIWLCFSTGQNLKLRFTAKFDATPSKGEGWMIDNLLVQKTFFHPVKKISMTDELLVYPTITSGIVNVELMKTSEKELIENIDLLNADGKLLESYGSNYAKVVLDISKHSVGVYYLRITARKKTSVYPVLYEVH
jgi:hypothetical protein